MPWEWLELQLCRDVYHCTPTELAEQDFETVMVHVLLMNTEARLRSGSGPGGSGAANTKALAEKLGIDTSNPPGPTHQTFSGPRR